MRAKVTKRTRSRRDRLRRLSIVFKAEIRLRIVAELYLRPMSPKEFFERFGGGSLERVAQHFEVLERHGWLRRIGHKQRSVKRRGPSENLFRATELPYFDAETWALLPYSIRLAFSWSTFTTTAGDLREAIEAAVLGGRPCPELSCSQLTLDAIAWDRVTALLDSGFESVFEEQVDAKLRVSEGGGKLSRGGVLLTGFESPADGRPALELPEGSEPEAPIFERLAPIFADELYMEILIELNDRELSIKGFTREWPGEESEATVRYRFGQLQKLAWIGVVKEVQRRAVKERVFRATRPAVGGDRSLAGVDRAVAKTPAWKAFAEFSDLVKEAIATGAFDLRDDRHLSWSIVSLDEEGWANVRRDLEQRTATIQREHERASKRIAKGAVPLKMTVATTALESPAGDDA